MIKYWHGREYQSGQLSSAIPFTQSESCSWFHIWVHTKYQYGSAGSCQADQTAKCAFVKRKEWRTRKKREEGKKKKEVVRGVLTWESALDLCWAYDTGNLPRVTTGTLLHLCVASTFTDPVYWCTHTQLLVAFHQKRQPDRLDPDDPVRDKGDILNIQLNSSASFLFICYLL